MPASTSLLLAPPFPETGGEHSYTHSQQVSYTTRPLYSLVAQHLPLPTSSRTVLRGSALH
jgi:hypothetical protein